MNFRVAAIALSLSAVALFAPTTAAFAEDHDDKRPIPGESVNSNHRQREVDDEDELHERYGDVEQVNLPPLVVKEGIGKADPLQPESLKDADGANPKRNLPVDPTSMNQNRGTPADTFFNSATIGLGVMGAGVIALGGMAIRRSVKIRKDPKADFLYQ